MAASKPQETQGNQGLYSSGQPLGGGFNTFNAGKPPSSPTKGMNSQATSSAPVIKDATTQGPKPFAKPDNAKPQSGKPEPKLTLV